MTTSRRAMVAGLTLGALLRLWLLTLPGTTDVIVWKVWSFAGSIDPTGVYGVGGVPPERRVLHWRGEGMTVDYPPLSLYELALTGRLYRWLRPEFDDTRLLNVSMKLPGLLAEITFLIVFFRFAQREYGHQVARWGALAFWLNPALLLNGSALGYLDLQMAVPLALAVLTAWRRDGLATGILLGIAVLTKAQAIFVLPVIVAMLLWRSSSRVAAAVRVVAAGATTGVAIVLPLIMRGAWSNLTQALGRLAAQDMLSAQAANVWWLLTWWLRVRDVWTDWGPRASLVQETRILTIDRAMALGYPNPRLIGLAVVTVALVWACVRARWASAATSFALAAWVIHAYALFATQVHENHLTPAVVLLAPAAAIDRRYRGAFWALTTVVALNMYFFYGLGQGFPPLLTRAVTGIDAAVPLGIASLATFLWISRTIARTARPEQAPVVA